MKDIEVSIKVRQALNRSLDLDGETLAILRTARQRALDCHQSHQSLELPMALAGTKYAARTHFEPHSLVYRIFIPLLMLVLGLYASNQWYQLQLQEEIIEIDAEVLTGDLPLDAYLDRGFDAWLKRSSD